MWFETPRQWSERLVRIGLVGLSIGLGAGCETPVSNGGDSQIDAPSHRPAADEPEFAQRRSKMVDHQLRARGISDPRVLEAMNRVPRHRFVPEELRPAAYEDRPLPIGLGQTISQPYIVALMTELARPQPDDRALDIGTGSGYQAAVLAELVDEVDSIEIHEELAEAAQARLKQLGYENVRAHQGDGYQGWPERAPYDLILLAAAPEHVPPALIEQLAPGGRLVLPVGEAGRQVLKLIEKEPDGSLTERRIVPVAFVPMTGEAQESEPPDSVDE